LNAPHSKCGVRFGGPGVRIPLSPREWSPVERETKHCVCILVGWEDQINVFKMAEFLQKDKINFYKELYHQAAIMVRGESDIIAQTANISALFWYSLPDINWVGFYFYKERELVLGPFQGKPACLRIAPGKGVCGTAFSSQKTIRVDDVHIFPGHIACDPESRSEIVVPVFKNKKVIAVLDVDSPVAGRFNEEDQAGLEKIVRLLENHFTYP
jgi:L-methionine (R)-S-oxide reductase